MAWRHGSALLHPPQRAEICRGASEGQNEHFKLLLHVSSRRLFFITAVPFGLISLSCTCLNTASIRNYSIIFTEVGSVFLQVFLSLSKKGVSGLSCFNSYAPGWRVLVLVRKVILKCGQLCASQETSSILSLNTYKLILLKFRILILFFARLEIRNSARAWSVQPRLPPVLIPLLSISIRLGTTSSHAPALFGSSCTWKLFFLFSWTAVFLSQEISGWLKPHMRMRAWECDTSCSWSKSSWQELALIWWLIVHPSHAVSCAWSFICTHRLSQPVCGCSSQSIHPLTPPATPPLLLPSLS